MFLGRQLTFLGAMQVVQIALQYIMELDLVK